MEVLARVIALEQGIVDRQSRAGAGLFASEDVAVPVIDETFAIRSIVSALQHSPRYRVLSLSENRVRLSEGTRDVGAGSTTGFPLVHEGPGGARPPPGGPGCNVSAYREERHRSSLQT